MDLFAKGQGTQADYLGGARPSSCSGKCLNMTCDKDCMISNKKLHSRDRP